MPWRPPWPKPRTYHYNTPIAQVNYLMDQAESMLRNRGDPRYLDYFHRHYYDIRDQVFDSLNRSTGVPGYSFPRWRHMTPADRSRRVSVIIQHVEYETWQERLPVDRPSTPPQEGQDEFSD